MKDKNKKGDKTFIKIPTLGKQKSIEVRRVSQTPFVGLFQQKTNKSSNVQLEVDVVYSEEDEEKDA